MNRLGILIYILCYLNSVILIAQELPPVEIYSTTDYGAENQNWAISQSSDKYIYVANNRGLLEFNGANWQLYESPNKTILRSVKVVDDKIYTGCYMEFGYWKRNDIGQLSYNSLSQKLKIDLIEDEQFWKIIDIDHWILFQSLNRIYIYNTQDGSCKFIESKTELPKMYKVDNSIYFQKFSDGIYKIENGMPILVTNDQIVKNNVVINIFIYEENFLIETQDAGFFVLTDDKLLKWDIPANNILNDVSVYSSIQLHDGSFILGTISNGVLHLTADGEINYEINGSNGLSNNTVLTVFEDSVNNIWLGLDNGVNCINIESPFRIYDDAKGKIGTVYTAIIFNDILYLGTNQGLFYKPYEEDTDFKFVDGTQGQVWCLVKIGSDLFCGHNSGTFIIKDKVAVPITNTPGTWNLKPIKGFPNLLLQGNYKGLNILENVNNSWRLRNKVDGFDISSRFFELYDNYNVFVSHEYKGVYKIKLNNELTKAIEVVKDTSINKGLYSSLIKYKNKILYAYKEGVFKYDNIKNAFIKDTLLSQVIDSINFTSGKLVLDDSTNYLWSFSDRYLNYLSPGKLTSTQEFNRVPLPNNLRKGKTGYENILHIQDKKYLFGTSSGYIVFDLDKMQMLKESFNVTINSIDINELYSSKTSINKSVPGEFRNKQNNIEFSFSIPEYNKYLEAEYQYQLEGIYDQWSNWSTTPNVFFKNLRFGDYIFNVKARAGNNESTNIATYKFKIARPWYLSNVMLSLYILLLVLLAFSTHNIYKTYYRKQQERLLFKAQRDLELKELENQQQFMRFKNEKLQHDIESKNRELAISTMSLIKKNEFLNNIKQELKKKSKEHSLKGVIKIIDKNLNNTDDWKFFEEAFNNADKDFLRKVKSKHPNLTPNDLRLCAYLRLNLSSKEIAPLLNISHRSVEVKRYRLRKKINLPHEDSLTNYILEL